MDNQNNTDKGFNINTPTAVLIGSVIIAMAIIFVNSYKGGFERPGAGANRPAGIDEKNIVIAPITEDDHFYGNPEAKVVMVEYSDTECPFCKRAHSIMKKVVDNSRGEVAWVYRHFPLDSLHSKARKEAEATECAAELGGNNKFWEYLDALFAITPANNGLDPSELPKLAARVGLDTTKFNICLSSGKYKNRVEKDYQDGLKVGVTGTPTTVLMNTKGEKKVIVGAQPEETLNAAIDKLK